MKNYLDRKVGKIRANVIRWALKDIIRERALEVEPTYLQKFFLYRMSTAKSGGRLLPLFRMSETAPKVGCLAPAQEFVTEAPQNLAGARRQVTGNFQAVTYTIMENVLAHPRSSVFLKDDRVYVPDFYFDNSDLDISEGHLLFWKNDRNMGAVFQPKATHAPSGIMICGAGVDNWYHWSIEFLPLVHLSHKLPDDYAHLPLIVPKGIMKISQFKDSIDAVRGQRTVVSIKHRLHSFEKLIVIDKVALEPIFLHQNRLPKVEHYSNHASELLSFRDRVKQNLRILPCVSDRKIFLARGSNTRSYNQDQLIDVAKEYGFLIVYPENLSFREQVELFHSSRYIVGASGAAFANLIYCQAQTRILSWIRSDYKEFCSFSNLAKLTGGEYRAMFLEQNLMLNKRRDGYHSSYNVPLDKFKDALEALLFSDKW